MEEGFQIGSEEDIRKVTAQLKNAALRAMQNYDLDWEQIQFNQLSDTCTFIIRANKEKVFLLRIHSGRNREEIASEIIWLDALNETLNVPLPQGVLTRTGAKTVKIDQENGACVYASLMHWVEGAPVNGRLSEEQIYKEGVLLANLHRASQHFELPPDFTRPAWDEQSFRQAMDRLEKHYENFLTNVEYALYQSAADRILQRLIGMQKDQGKYGLIHGDLHQGNLVFYNGEPRPIDFGRCGFGYFLYDIAHTILGLYPAQRELVIKGYQSIGELGDEWLPELEAFTVMVMIENYCHHAPDPRETEGLKGEQPYAQAIIKHYLRGAPFLFNAIEI